MIRDLSETLRAILDDPGLAGSFPELAAAQIVFDQPVESFKPAQTTVDLFLYDVRENMELRSNEPVVKRNNGQAMIQPAPLRVVCSYLVTAWPVGGAEPALQEHRLLGQTLQVLSRYPTIPTTFLKGKLVAQEPPLPMMAAKPDGLKEPSEFWTALGNKLRPSISVTATVAMDLFAPLAAPTVITGEVRLGERTAPDKQKISPATQQVFFRIGGQVPEVHSGKAQGGAAGPPPTITLANSASTTDDFYNEMRIEITGGAGSGQVRTIIDYVGATRIVTVNSNWRTVPDNTSTYAVNASAAVVTLVELGLATTIDAHGQYSLGPIPAGTYTLRVQKGAVVKEISITVPAPKGSNYNVQL